MGAKGGGGGNGGRSNGGGARSGEIQFKPYGDMGRTITFDQKTSDQIRAIEKNLVSGKIGEKELLATKDTMLRARTNLYNKKSQYTEAQYNQLYKETTRRIDSMDYLLRRTTEIRLKK